MFIHEAIAARTEARPYVTRKSWLYPTPNCVPAAVKMLPTNSPDGCVLVSESAKFPRYGWMPQAEDLIANDWIPVSL